MSKAKDTQTGSRKKRPNILFLITDQQRADCMSALGHHTVKTPHLDRLASRGVLFTNAFTASQPCGPSRACIDTGRYIHANRSSWNEVSLPDDEITMGEYFSREGYRTAWVGKGYYVRDHYANRSEINELLANIGQAVPIDTDRWYEGPPPGWDNWAFEMGGDKSIYSAYLREKGYQNTGAKTPDGELLHPLEFRACKYPLSIRAEDRRPAFLADRTMDFIRNAKSEERPWLLQLNWTTPHYPVVAPDPYHKMYDVSLVMLNRHQDELTDGHPLHKVFRKESGGQCLDDEELCGQFRATYYAMISEVDYQVGRLMDFLEQEGIDKETIIVFSSDHGEYAGDHWMQDKELWFDEAYRVPLIIADPSPEANSTRGQKSEALVENIDILPTLMEATGMKVPHQIQGKSLMPMLHTGITPKDWRTEVHADWDFRFYWSSRELGLRPELCRMWMIRDNDLKYVFFNALPDILYDLKNDPSEFHNLADDPKWREIVEEYRKKLMIWRMSTEDNSRIGWTHQRRPRFGRNPFRFPTAWE